MMGVKWHRAVGLIYVSLITSEVEHLFPFLLAIQASFPVNFLFISFVHISINLFVFSSMILALLIMFWILMFCWFK